MQVWVRACAGCQVPDLDSLFPRPEHVSAWPRWRCSWCLGTGWEPAALEFPDASAGAKDLTSRG